MNRSEESEELAPVESEYSWQSLKPKPCSVRGVLDQLSAFIQIDLQENPWDCTCDIVSLKNWMELSSTSVVVNEITCDSPSKHAGRLLRSLRNDAICPETSEVPPTKATTVISSSTEATPFSAITPTDKVPEVHPEVPLSVLILGLLVVFILSVCFGAGLFVFVLKRRKGVENVPSGANNLDLNSFQVQYGSYNTESSAGKSESHVYNYIPPPVGQMCQNPIYMQKENEQVAYYRNMKELSFSTLDPKKEELARSPAYTISTVEFIDKQPCANREPELLYQNITERVKELPAAGPLSYNFCTLPKRPFIQPHETTRRHNQDRLNKTVLYGTPRKYAETSKNEHPLLPGKLKTEPDYLESLKYPELHRVILFKKVLKKLYTPSPIITAAKPNLVPASSARDASKPDSVPASSARDAIKPDPVPASGARDATRPCPEPVSGMTDAAHPGPEPVSVARDTACPDPVPVSSVRNAAHPGPEPVSGATDTTCPDPVPVPRVRDIAHPDPAPVPGVRDTTWDVLATKEVSQPVPLSYVKIVPVGVTPDLTAVPLTSATTPPDTSPQSCPRTCR
ncbi:hypothetical protein P4O66_003847 [Electrophorus voltai]|uniref:LRRCT domain-containing protein n=1 Tax=Electrophorus voltai TaxID=2609070 RepID=A0AAD8ZTE9_9TELE|nr:hypothetical protein P4O66_003847 [Electrophorus voltai]